MRGAVHPVSRFPPDGAAAGDVMEEGTRKAIPLRRTRGAGRGTAAPETRRWVDGLSAGLGVLLAPPRQVWLAGLGTTALAVRGVRFGWAQLLAEGTSAESWLRERLRRDGEHGAAA
jgi:hypothetical protein